MKRIFDDKTKQIKAKHYRVIIYPVIFFILWFILFLIISSIGTLPSWQIWLILISLPILILCVGSAGAYYDEKLKNLDLKETKITKSANVFVTIFFIVSGVIAFLFTLLMLFSMILPKI
jgi:hypothetical protein